MSLTVCILASGSSGNCTLLRSRETVLLVDAGLSGREMGRRLEGLGVGLEAIHGVCLSHEHSDHTAGISLLHRRHGIPIYANAGTIDGMRRDPRCATIPWQMFSNGSAFEIGDLRIEPFSVPHDAYDPVGFVVRGDGVSVGIVTDIGMPTSLVRQKLRDCDALIVESNHDEQMLREAARPWALKQRIMGRQGHLSNERAAELIREVAGPRLDQVFLAHLSADCNRPDLALRAVRDALTQAGLTHVRVELTYADRPSEVWQSEAATRNAVGM